MTKQYYPLEINFSDNSYFLLWYTDEEDGVEIEEEKIIWFRTLIELENYSLNNQIELNTTENRIVYDFDKLENWAKSDIRKYNPVEILNAWNLFTDLSISLNKKYSGDIPEILRDRIFERLNDITIWNNTEARRQKLYNLENWNEEEIQKVKSILVEGLNIFKCCILK